MTRQAYPGSGPRFISLAVLSAFGILACASPATTTGNTGGTTGGGTGGTKATGGTTGGGTGGSVSTGGSTGSGGSVLTGGSTGTGGSGTTGGTTGTGGSVSTGGTTGTGGSSTGGTTGTGGSAGGSGSCGNTDMSSINEDASGYVCGNQWGIKGAWYCYTSDASNACNKTGAIPWSSSSNGMCLQGMIASGGTALLGFKVNSGPPGGGAAFGSWDASKIVGFAITLASGSTGTGSGGSVLYVEYPTTKNVLGNGDAPGVTVPGVAGTSVTYNALFSDALLANYTTMQNSVDPTQLTDVKVSIPSDTSSRSYDICITKVVPLMAAPSPVVATGSYGPAWTNHLPQAVNGINGYAVQSTPFDKSNGFPMSIQIMPKSDGVGFTYQAMSSASGNSPAAFPAIVSGWGPGEAGAQFYGPYKGGQTIGGTNKLTSVMSNWTFTMGSGASGDAAYDVWFGNSKNPTKPQTELMIWVGNTGKTPLGSNTNHTFGGRTLYFSPASDNANKTGEETISYSVPSGTNDSPATVDLLSYFQDAVANAHGMLSNNSFLLGVQAGFEVYSGNWSTTDYNIDIR